MLVIVIVLVVVFPPFRWHREEPRTITSTSTIGDQPEPGLGGLPRPKTLPCQSAVWAIRGLCGQL